MNTELTTTKSGLPSSYKPGVGLESVGVEDYKQGYLSLLHPLSKAVEANSELKAGQILDSKTGEVVGGQGKPVELWFVGFKKYWSETPYKDADEIKYPLDKSNFTLPWIRS